MIKILESKKSKEDIAIEGANLYTSHLNSKIIKPDQTLITTDDNYIPIPQFYAGRSIFITGGTGFIGKVLIEKLLRSCPEIRNIYVLIRPKKGQEVSERLDQLFNDAVFSTLRRKSPHQLNKVIPITGDMTLEELGISTSDQDVLCRNVSIVFHSAATVRFSEKLKLAVTINMLGTKRLVQLCQRMMSLDALIHVSTAYCNCDRSDVSEVLYPAPYKPEDIISLVNTFPDKTLEELTPALIAQKPNTYTLTKALAEHMLLKEGGNLPIAIVRPSIVTSTLREPLAGWTDNFNGPLGLLCAVNQGLLRTLICEEKCVADFVPVDIVVNLIITVAWRTASRKFDDPLIYNCCSGQRNPIRWGEFVRSVLDQSRKNPLEDCLWYPDLVLRRNQLLHNAHGFLAHYIPAYLLDVFARIVGKKPRMIEAQNKIAKFVGITQYFCTRQWHFRDDNVRALLTVMKEQDGETFAFDVCTIDWEKYIESYVMGFREYLSKQHPETVVSSRKRVMRLYYLEQLTKLLTGTLVGILLIANWEA